jgi:hypothetical protein
MPESSKARPGLDAASAVSPGQSSDARQLRQAELIDLAVEDVDGHGDAHPVNRRLDVHK